MNWLIQVLLCCVPQIIMLGSMVVMASFKRQLIQTHEQHTREIEALRVQLIQGHPEQPTTVTTSVTVGMPELPSTGGPTTPVGVSALTKKRE